MSVTKFTNSDVSPRVGVHMQREMLRHAQPHIVLDNFGKLKPMPKNKGQTMKFRRPKTFTAADTPLAEGVTPTATQFGYEDVDTTLKQYGMLVEITDVIEDTHEDPVLNDAAVQAGENLGRTVEKLTYGVVKAGTNVFYANGSSRSDVNEPITLAKQRAVIRGLKAQKAMKITKVLDGSIKIGTKPVEAGYVAVCHSDCEADIRDLAGFTPVAEYGVRKTVHEMEFGTVEDVRYVCSSDLDPFLDAGAALGGGSITAVSNGGTDSDVYPILFFAADAFGRVPLRGFESVDPTIIKPQQKDKSDPLGQRGYVGWKTWFVAVILNQAWMARLEVAVTAL